ncbi:MAG: cytochrome c peroxidase [Salibacteraceae bacterium]|jgi:cytochrome c peroxidase
MANLRIFIFLAMTMYRIKYLSLFLIMGALFLTSLIIPNNDFENQLLADLNRFHQQTKNFKLAAQDYKKNTISIDSLQNQVLRTRLSYKKVEFVAEYYYPSFIEEHINGAPLLHIEKFSTLPVVMTPEGLQVLDEMAFSDEVESMKDEMVVLSGILESKTSELILGFKNKRIRKIEIKEACKQELVRVFTMGVSGFDTPGSLNALPEASVAMTSMHNALSNIQGDYTSALNLFTEAIDYINLSKSFDEFDRAYFYKEFVGPLYKEVNALAFDVNNSEPSLNYFAVNPFSNSLFEANFLNPYYYTLLTEEEDNDEVRKLGEKLFFDPILSKSETLSCSSCHNPEKGFADGVPKSVVGPNGETVLRNSPTLLNSVYSDRYFYDLRAFNLEQQLEHVIFNENEFNTAYSAIVTKLSADPEYAELFKNTFGKNGINRENFSKSLSSYVLSLQSFDSPFDQYIRGEKDSIDSKVIDGFNLFMGKAACATCHFPPTFSGLVPPLYKKNETEILGVEKTPIGFHTVLDADEGRYANGIQSEQAWIYKKSFKTSTIRNISKTAPYFHNGAYATLEEVIDFYNDGGGAGVGLEVTNQTLSSDPLGLTKKEKEALILFMESL